MNSSFHGSGSPSVGGGGGGGIVVPSWFSFIAATVPADAAAATRDTRRSSRREPRGPLSDEGGARRCGWLAAPRRHGVALRGVPVRRAPSTAGAHETVGEVVTIDAVVDVVAHGAITLLNGVIEMLLAVASPITLAVSVMALSLWWLAGVDVEELDRLGQKPEVERH